MQLARCVRPTPIATGYYACSSRSPPHHATSLALDKKCQISHLAENILGFHAYDSGGVAAKIKVNRRRVLQGTVALLCAQLWPAKALAEQTQTEVVKVGSTVVQGEPQSRAARKILKLFDKLFTTMKQTRYQHRTVVRRRQGIFLWDCSGMAAWILKRTAPLARTALTRERPVARDFYHVIRRAPTRRAKGGWRRLKHIADARPGDVFAWIRPPNFPSRNTGHVGFVVDTPRPVPEIPGAYAVKIIDATSFPHEDDTRSPEGEGGMGIGTLLFLTDGNGHATAYGWLGTASRGVVETTILFGRVTR